MRLRLPLALAGGALGVALVLGACVLLLALGFVRYSAGLVLDLPAPESSLPYEPSSLALDAIPPLYLHLYEAAAARYGLDWTILAGIGTVECDNGRDPAPSCTVQGALNYAGAGGPAQFLVSTWQRYGVTPTGTGTPNMWNPADAIFSMANYLRASGAPGDYARAIFAYNHALWYVNEVLSWAERYRAAYGRQTPRRALPAATDPGTGPAPKASPRHAQRREPG
jgi:membrane-bound lytic murein transglycosylase B